MRFGLALPQYGFSLPGGEVGFETTAAWARRAEELGFDSVWLSDHFFYTFTRYGGDPTPIPAIEPMTALAGAGGDRRRGSAWERWCSARRSGIRRSSRRWR